MEVDREGPGTFIVGRTKLELRARRWLLTQPTLQMLHNISTPWPCLSFDIIRDKLGDESQGLSCDHVHRGWYAGGEQKGYGQPADGHEVQRAATGWSVSMTANRATKMMTTKPGTRSSSQGHSSQLDNEPGYARIRPRPGSLEAADHPHGDPDRDPETSISTTSLPSRFLRYPGIDQLTRSRTSPYPPSAAHKAEGYAVDWSPLHPAGKLLTGDNNGLIYADDENRRRWLGQRILVRSRDTRAASRRSSGVPRRRPVFSSASSDGTIRVWDVRSKSRQARDYDEGQRYRR